MATLTWDNLRWPMDLTELVEDRTNTLWTQYNLATDRYRHQVLSRMALDYPSARLLGSPEECRRLTGFLYHPGTTSEEWQQITATIANEGLGTIVKNAKKVLERFVKWFMEQIDKMFNYFFGVKGARVIGTIYIEEQLFAMRDTLAVPNMVLTDAPVQIYSYSNFTTLYNALGTIYNNLVQFQRDLTLDDRQIVNLKMRDFQELHRFGARLVDNQFVDYSSSELIATSYSVPAKAGWSKSNMEFMIAKLIDLLEKRSAEPLLKEFEPIMKKITSSEHISSEVVNARITICNTLKTMLRSYQLWSERLCQSFTKIRLVHAKD